MMDDLWFDTDGLGRCIGFVKREDGKTQIVWAFGDAVGVRTPAEDALQWGFEHDFEDVAPDKAARLYAAWCRAQARQARELLSMTEGLMKENRMTKVTKKPKLVYDYHGVYEDRSLYVFGHVLVPNLVRIGAYEPPERRTPDMEYAPPFQYGLLPFLLWTMIVMVAAIPVKVAILTWGPAWMQ